MHNPEARHSGSPRVSLLLPNRNHGRFLAQAINSVLEQEFKDLEFIISDNASSDDSPRIIRQFVRRHPRIQFHAHPVDLGLAGNLNFCLAQAKGQYVKFLCADDMFTSPGSLGKLVAMLDQAPDIVLATSSSQVIDQDSRVYSLRHFLPADTVENGTEACRRCVRKGSNEIGEPSLVLFRKAAVQAGFDVSYRFWIDVDFWLRLMDQGRVAYSLQALTAFRQHPGQRSNECLAQGLGLAEFCRLLAEHAHRPWLGKRAARNRLFEELYRCQKRKAVGSDQAAILNALQQLGGQKGYRTFRLFRLFRRPCANLRNSLRKRIA